MKTVPKLLVLGFAFLGSLALAAPAHAMTGSGTTQNPYLISTCTDLQNIENGTSTTYWLANDINCSETSTWNSTDGFVPIWDFAGTFDGRGYTISNLHIHRPSDNYQGLFGRTGNATIVNVHFSGGSVEGLDYVGSAVGYINGTATIQGVSSDMSVTADQDVAGGIAGVSYGGTSFAKDSFVGSVTGRNDVGGLIGDLTYGTSIADSFASSTISGNDSVGGLVGVVEGNCGDFSLTRSYANGSATASGGNVGGLVGYMTTTSCYVDTISDSFSAMRLTGVNVGGFVADQVSAALRVTDSYFDSNAAATTSCTDLISGGSSDTTGCHSFDTGSTPTYLMNNTTDEPFTTGAWNFTNIWLTHASGYPTLRSVDPTTYHAPTAPSNLVVANKTDQGLQLNVSWDPSSGGELPVQGYNIDVKTANETWDNSFYETSLEATDSPSEIINEDAVLYSHSYDVRVQTFSAYGTSDWVEIIHNTGDAPVHNISSCADLEAIDDDSSAYNTKDTYKLTQSFSCEGTDFVPIGADPSGWDGDYFEGTFDGQGNTISDLTINEPGNNNVGLFTGAYNATIENVTLHTGSVTGQYYVGGVVGYVEDSFTIDNVHSDLNVSSASGAEYIGGLVGYADQYSEYFATSSISNNSSSGNVVGSNEVGGLVGYLYIEPDGSDNASSTLNVDNNTFTGTASGGEAWPSADNIGGLIGYADFENDEYNYDSMDISISGNTVTSSNISGGGEIAGLAGALYQYLGEDNNESTLTIASNTIDSTISGTSDEIGGLIGYLGPDADYEYGTLVTNITSNSVSGTISAVYGYVGGLIGEGETELYEDYSTVTFNMSRNEVLANISSENSGDIGGLAGYLYQYASNGTDITFNQTLAQNFVANTIQANGSNDGGLFGEFYNDGFNASISDSYFNGIASGTDNVGGLVGYAGQYDGTTLTIERSYAAGSVHGGIESKIGGLVGDLDNGPMDFKSVFSAVTLDGDAVMGMIIGENDDSYTMEDAVYDAAKNPSLPSTRNCIATEDDPEGCVAVDTAGSPDANYFYNNSANLPFSSEASDWDFSGVWLSHTANYPTLRALPVVVTGPFTITASAGSGGYISPIGDTSVTSGGSQAYTITPNTGFSVADVKVDGSSVGTVSSYSFSDVTEAHSISATFRQNGGTTHGSGGGGGGGGSGARVGVSASAAAPTSVGATQSPASQGSPSTGTTGASSGTARNLATGSHSSDVQSLQSLLITIDAGKAATKLKTSGPSGYFGPMTKAALIEYQKSVGIKPATGYFGPLTRAAMKAAKVPGIWW